MAQKKLKIMSVHGLGDHRNSTWETTWAEAISSVFPGHADIDLEFVFVTYDDIFEKTDISPWEAARAVWKLAKSGVGSLRKRGFLEGISDKIRWTAGYAVAWVEDDGFKKKTRKRLLDSVKEHEPDIIIGHSLGSLVTYDAFSHKDSQHDTIAPLLAKSHYVTIGSQIGNPFVIRNLTPGRITSLPVKTWRHFYNRHDDIFTSPLKLFNIQNFRQIDTPFDEPGIGDHAAEKYLSHSNAVEDFWKPVAEEVINPKAFAPARRKATKAPVKREMRKSQRALLVGINDYPSESDRLFGCVNDVFLMSSVLQECGFEPDNIRICLDDRATAKGILERMEWLVDDPQPGDERLFFYSGHGARIPEYGNNMEPDHHLECLVPWDFDWSPETAITDDQIATLYSQLPYDLRLAMIFDCCHSGGVHRDSGAKSRGITPPDDIRHRELKWDLDAEMWVPRNFQRLDRQFSRSKNDKQSYFGEDGATMRLGRASSFRGLTNAQYNRLKKQADGKPIGPYLPLILEACQEHELSYEYQHGVTSYGAFTYSLASILRRNSRSKPLSFKDLVEEAREQLEELNYNQMPQILGPEMVMTANIPWKR